MNFLGDEDRLFYVFKTKDYSFKTVLKNKGLVTKSYGRYDLRYSIFSSLVLLLLVYSHCYSMTYEIAVLYDKYLPCIKAAENLIEECRAIFPAPEGKEEFPEYLQVCEELGSKITI